MHKPSYIAYHVLALVTAAVWGSTFVSTKILLTNGLSPAQIMVIRFSIAYLLILLLSHRPLFSRKLSDELLMIGAGITGGSLYFLAENSALIYTQASNVAIIIAVTPLLTAIAAHFFSRGERFSRTLATGSVIALAGVVLVVLNGRFVLHLNPKGDMLTIAAAVLWALYSIIIVRLQRRYSSLFITRKVFFYGIVTLLPYLFIHEASLDFGLLLRPAVIGNLLFLGLIASFTCYWAWNAAIARIGSVNASNYLYLNPVVALITSAIALDERITVTALIGTALIMLGVAVCEKLPARTSARRRR